MVGVVVNRRNHSWRRKVPFIFTATLALVLTGAYISIGIDIPAGSYDLETPSLERRLAGGGLVILGYAVEIAGLIWARKHLAQFTIPLATLSLIARIERPSDRRRLGELSRKRSIMRQLELLARRYEYVGRYLASGDPVADAQARQWGLALATRLRAYKRLLLTPSTESAETVVVAGLLEDCRATLSDKWEQLDGVSELLPTARPKRTVRIAWSILGLALTVGALLIIAYSFSLGPAAPALVSLIGTFGMWALANAGLPLRQVAEAKDAISGLIDVGK